MIILETKNLVKQYSNHLALNNVSIQVPKGAIFGLLGPNGAGKTSIIRIINQITAPDSGSVLFEGNSIERKDISQIGYLPEERGLYKKMKVAEHVLYLAQLKGMSKSEAIKRVQFWFNRFDIEAWHNKTVEELSKGMQQKIQFISTILHQPKLLILDEPFSGFDPINAQIVKEEILRLKEEGTTIILSTHNMASVEEICDDIALINQGVVLLSGTVKTIREKNKHNKLIVEMTSPDSPLDALNAYFNGRASAISEGDFHTLTIEADLHQSANDIIYKLLPIGHIVSVKEHLPTMNDIFISSVSNHNQKSSTR